MNVHNIYTFKGRNGGSYGQSAKGYTFEILKICPSIISAPMIPFRFLHLQPTNNT